MFHLVSISDQKRLNRGTVDILVYKFATNCLSSLGVQKSVNSTHQNIGVIIAHLEYFGVILGLFTQLLFLYLYPNNSE